MLGSFIILKLAVREPFEININIVTLFMARSELLLYFVASFMRTWHKCLRPRQHQRHREPQPQRLR